MELSSINCCVYLFFIIVTVTRAENSFSRNIARRLTCEPVSNQTVSHGPCVVHISAVGDSDTIHYVSANHGTPTLLAARTKAPTDIDVNWPFFMAVNDSSGGSIKFNSSQPDVVIALMFTKLIEFDDVDDTADLDYYAKKNNTWIKSYSLANAAWSNITVDGLYNIELTIVNVKNVLPGANNGSLSFKVQVFSSDGFDLNLPHLPHSANISVIDVTLDGLVVQRPKSRFAIEVVMVSNANLGHDMAMTKRKSFDDSLTPGTFSYIDWVTDEEPDNTSAFFQWKPVCYNSPERKRQSSLLTLEYPLATYNLSEYEMYQHGLMFAYFGFSAANYTRMQSSNVSFGTPGDENWYNNTAHPYITWSISVGFGSPPTQEVSLLIILVVSIGLGIPFLLIICGIIFIIVKQCRSRYLGYAPISGGYEQIN